jgi:methyl-accepting chemotaxis protein
VRTPGWMGRDRVILYNKQIFSLKLKNMTTNQPPSRIEQNLEMLIDQVGRFTEGLVELRLLLVDEMRELKDTIRQLGDTIRQQHEASMAEYAEMKTAMNRQHESSMAEYAEMRENSRQQTEEFRLGMAEIKAVVQQQAETTADLVQIVKQLLSERR